MKTLEEALQRIEELEQENEKLRNKLARVLKMGGNVKGRKWHGEAWTASYNEFVKKYENGMSLQDIIDEGVISRSTAFRYRAFYNLVKEDQEEKEENN